MENAQEEFLKIFTAELAERFTSKEIQEIQNLLAYSLKGFTITKTGKELVVYRDDNVKLLKYFFAAKEVKGCSKRTLQYYGQTLKEFLTVTQNAELTKIDALGIQYYLSTKKRDGVSNVCLNNLRRNLSSFFGWLQKNKFRADNPIEQIPKVKVPKRRREAFSEEELEKIRGEADVRERAIVEVLLSTGCRISELCGIERSQVDFGRGEASVIGKGNKERTVYFNQASLFYLQKYLDTRTDSTPALFVSELNYAQIGKRPMAVSGIEIIVRELGKRAGVKKVHPHRFRHTFATKALSRGMPIELIQQLLGHEHVDTTLIYAKVDESQLRYAHDKYCY